MNDSSNTTALFPLYADSPENISRKHTFGKSLADVDYIYNGCYNREDDPADHTPHFKAVRLG